MRCANKALGKMKGFLKQAQDPPGDVRELDKMQIYSVDPRWACKSWFLTSPQVLLLLSLVHRQYFQQQTLLGLQEAKKNPERAEEIKLHEYSNLTGVVVPLELPKITE